MYAATVKQFSMCGSIIVVLDEHTLVPIVRNAQSLPTSPLLVFTSFTESTHVLPQLRAVGCRSDNLIFSTVMPPGKHTEIRNLVHRYFPARDISFLAVEGYYSAQLFVAGLCFLCQHLSPKNTLTHHTSHITVLKEALLCCPENITRECFLDALYSKRFWDVGIELGPFWRAGPDQQQPAKPQDQGCNQGMQYVCVPHRPQVM